MQKRNAGQLAVLCLGALLVTGCNHQQKAEAGNTAQRAEKGAQQAVQQAEKSLSDGAITLKVKTAMTASARLNTSALDVDTKDHVVYLRGAVAGGGQKALAERIAKDTVGPDIKVVNQLQVRPPATGQKGGTK